MAQICIRKALPEDAEEISDIWIVICAEREYSAVNRPFTPKQEREYLISLSDHEGIFVAEFEDQIVGFQSLDRWAKYSDSFDHVGVIGTFVLPMWRRKKIGNQLTQYSFNFARKHNYEKIVIYIRASNSGAINFYSILGFVQKGILARQVKIDNQYDDEIFMEFFL